MDNPEKRIEIYLSYLRTFPNCITEDLKSLILSDLKLMLTEPTYLHLHAKIIDIIPLFT